MLFGKYFAHRPACEQVKDDLRRVLAGAELFRGHLDKRLVMGFVCQRENRRYKLAVRASASDRLQKNVIPCIIRDGSIAGCKIISRYISDLPDQILIRIPNLDQTIKGRIIWRDQGSAGIEFKWDANPPDERRQAPRQGVVIPTVIMDQNLNKLTDGIISDASRTGCRITSEDVSTLPDDIYIEVPSLTEPVKARIVKREDNMARLEFSMESNFYVLDDT